MLAGCGGDEAEEPVLPLIGELDEAMAAVDAELGGPTAFFEVNATTTLVNLFVAAEGGTQVVPYVYVDGALREPGPPGEVAGGATFVAEDVPAVDDTVVDRLLEELDAPILERFVVTGAGDGAVVLEVIVASERGGRLAVAVSPTGEILSVDPL
jgi:hypothetical protein